jgi:predicted dinucleotide-binding enzyme
MCRSQAEHLARLLPQSFVVKSFNVLSAYSLENGGLQGSNQVMERGEGRGGGTAIGMRI